MAPAAAPGSGLRDRVDPLVPGGRSIDVDDQEGTGGRIEAAQVLLQTLTPGSVGFQCAPRLAEIKDRIPGYANLVRFDAIGRVVCAAATVPPDPARRKARGTRR